jgi:uncharacterized phage protein gp47/JayE
MMALFQEKTGREVGNSVDLSVRLYAVAAELYALAAQGEWIQKQCFPQTAQGSFLDQHAELRGLSRQAATQSVGKLRFSIDRAGQSDLIIQAGTVCMTAGQVRFETTETVTLKAGKLYVEAEAQAIEPGSAGNVAAGTVLTMAVAPVGIRRCGNPEPFTGGMDEETDESLRSRVLETYRRLANGANAAYYEKEALAFSTDVAAVTVVGRSRGIGTVDVVPAVWKGVPEQSLLDGLQAYFEARREIAVDVKVIPPTEKSVNLTVELEAAQGADYDTVAGRVEAVLKDWFNGERLGENILRVKLGALIYGVDGVANYVLTAPAQDVDVQATELPRLGVLTIRRKGET